MKPYNCDTIPGKTPSNYHNYICDTEDDLDSIDLKRTCPGSTAIIMKPIYKEMILGVDMLWHLKSMDTSGGGSSSGGDATEIEEIPDDVLANMLNTYLPLDEPEDAETIEEIPADVMDDLLDTYLSLD